jgi:hypothetical protein
MDAALESLREVLGLTVDREWKKGDMRRPSGICDASGFNACVADTGTSQELMLVVRKFLDLCRRMEVGLTSDGLATELDIGLSVGGSAQFTASVLLTLDDLRLCSEIGLPVRVSCYPASDPEDAKPT